MEVQTVTNKPDRFMGFEEIFPFWSKNLIMLITDWI